MLRRGFPLVLLAVLVGCPAAPTTGLPAPTPTRKTTVKTAATATPGPLPTLGGPTPTPEPGLAATPTPLPATPTPEPTGTPTPEPADYTLGTLAGGTSGFADAAGPDARFDNPNGVDLDGAGALYVADAGNHRIRKVAPDGATTTLAGGEAGFVNGPVAAARFNNPYGVAVAADGTVYVADTGNHCIRRIAGGDVTVFAGSGTEGFVDGTAADARFKSPFSLALGPEGDLYVADAGNHAIRKVTPAGAVSTLVGGIAGSVNGPFSAAKLSVPNDLAFDGADKLYVADAINHDVRVVDLKLGIVTTLAGSGTAGFTNDKGVKAKFHSPTGLTVAKNGDVLVADSLNHAIRRIRPDGTTTTVAGGAEGMVEGAADVARFNGPTDLAVNKDGQLLIADTNNNRIRVAKR